jgi:lipoprotein-releasing system permease protein
MMLISEAPGIGLQQKIREKVAAFNGHITITNYEDNQSQVSVTPVSIHQDFYPKFKTVSGSNPVLAIFA